MTNVSIVIPVFNGERYISDCINSCLRQSYRDFEIIVVDDGSTDGTSKILDEYYSKGLIRRFWKINGGTASALNLGIDMMEGKWFKWLSADDVLTPDTLQKMLVAISTIPQHENYVYYTNYEIIDENDHHVKLFIEPERKQIRNERHAELFWNYYGNASSSLIHKSVIDKIGKFKEGLAFGEDYEYWLRLCLKFNFTLYHLPIISVKYRVHKDSLTSTKKHSDNLRALEELKKEYEKYLTKEQKQYLKTLESKLKKKLLKKLPIPIRSHVVSIYQRFK